VEQLLYRTLEKTGEKVSAIGFIAMKASGAWGLRCAMAPGRSFPRD
jgi:hypothetical protein